MSILRLSTGTEDRWGKNKRVRKEYKSSSMFPFSVLATFICYIPCANLISAVSPTSYLAACSYFSAPCAHV